MRTLLSWPLALMFFGWVAFDRIYPATPAGATVPSAPAPLLAQPHMPLPAAQAKLDQLVSWEFHEAPLDEAMKYIEKKLDLPIRIQTHSLHDQGVAADTLVTFRMNNVRASTALELLLADHQLVMRWHGECLVVDHRDAVEPLATRVYPVRDLVTFEDENGTFSSCNDLIDTIETTIQPAGWKNTGTGEGTINEIAAADSIAVTAGESVHEQIGQLLGTLRAARELQGMRGPTKVRRPNPGVGGSFGCFGGGSLGGGGGQGISGGGFSGGFF